MGNPDMIKMSGAHPNSESPAGQGNGKTKDHVEEQRKVTQSKQAVPLMDPSSPISKDKLRIVCLSDTHGKVEKSRLIVPPGDILLHAGDITMNGHLQEVVRFNKYIGQLPHTWKIVIAGNHDITFDEEIISKPQTMRLFGIRDPVFRESLKDLGVQKVPDLLTKCVYLQDTSVKICGVNIYGSPWSPKHFKKWAFQYKHGRDSVSPWERIEPNTDILMTHSPPLGFGDLNTSNKNAGCADLLNTVQRRVKPKFHVFGHIHEGYGLTTDGVTTYINASTCTTKYAPLNKPIVFDFPILEGHSKDELLQGSCSEL